MGFARHSKRQFLPFPDIRIDRGRRDEEDRRFGQRPNPVHDYSQICLILVQRDPRRGFRPGRRQPLVSRVVGPEQNRGEKGVLTQKRDHEAVEGLDRPAAMLVWNILSVNEE